MIQQEFLENEYIKTFSTLGYEIRNIENGDTFLEAIDKMEWHNMYEEVIPSEEENEENNEEDKMEETESWNN